MSEKPKINIPIVVEGKYDKIKLDSILDAKVITTDGFGVFASAEKKQLIRRLASARGLIVLTDSDGAGLVIRNYFNSILPKGRVIHLYTPQVEGKEKRKKTASKAGLLGVEGIEADILRALFAPYSSENSPNSSEENSGREVTKADFFADGLSGGDGSAERRTRLAKALELPDNLSANALLSAINLLCGYDKYKEILSDFAKARKVSDNESANG